MNHALAIADRIVYRGTTTADLRMTLPHAMVLFDNPSDLAIAAFPCQIYTYLARLLPTETMQRLRLPYNNPRDWWIELQRIATEVGAKKNFTLKSKPVTSLKQPTGVIMGKKKARLDKTKKIKKLVEENPRSIGSGGFKSWALLKPNMTVEEYLQLGGRAQDLQWDLKKKYVELV